MHRIVVLALDGVVPLNLATPFSIFGDARDADGRPLYSLTLAGARAGPVATSAGFPITVARGLRALAAADTIVVPATSTFREPADPAVLRALRRTNARVMSICAGAFVLAEAGLLDGRRATTHWAYADAFRSRFPAVALDPAVLYVDEGDVLTSAGAAAGLDLCLYVVAADRRAPAGRHAGREPRGDARLGARSSRLAPDDRRAGQARGDEPPHADPAVQGGDRDDAVAVADHPAHGPRPAAAGGDRSADRGGRRPQRLRLGAVAARAFPPLAGHESPGLPGDVPPC
jgi:putative intracellular protease/amidase